MPRKKLSDAERKYARHSGEDFEEAVRLVKVEGYNISQAAEMMGIARKTLSDRCNEKHMGNVGHPTTLNKTEEDMLVNYINFMHARAFSLPIPLVKIFAMQIARKNGKTFNLRSGPGKTWWNSFFQRNKSKIGNRKADTLDRARAKMGNLQVVFEYYVKLKALMTEMDVLDKPELIFNADESGLNLELRKGKVVVPKGAAHSYAQAKGGRDHVTVQCCVSAAGQTIPPMIIYSQSFPSKNYVENGPPNPVYAKTPTGYIDGELFLVWLTECFHENTKHLPKRLLIIDGHGSHVTLDVIDKARELGIELFCLPPHTTHLLQPLDVALYGPLKTYFSNITDKIQIIKLGVTRNITLCKTEFSAVFKLAMDETFIPAKIRCAFEVCWIYPFNLYVINKRLTTGTSSDTTKLNTSSSLPSAPTQAPSVAPATTPAPVTPTAVTEQLPSAVTEAEPLPSAVTEAEPLPSAVTEAEPLPCSSKSVPKDVQPSGSPSPYSTIDFTVGVLNPLPSTPLPAPHPLEGLVPRNYFNLFVTPVEDEKKKKQSRVITTSRWITSADYRDKLAEKERVAAEIENAKQERKRIREEKRKLKEQAKNGKKAGGKKKKKNDERSVEENENEMDVEDELYDINNNNNNNNNDNDDGEYNIDEFISEQQALRKSMRTRKPNVKYVDNDSSEEEESEEEEENEDDEDNLCGIYRRKIPPKLSKAVQRDFRALSRALDNWIFCDKCETWFHNQCEQSTLEDLDKEVYECKSCRDEAYVMSKKTN